MSWIPRTWVKMPSLMGHTRNLSPGEAEIRVGIQWPSLISEFQVHLKNLSQKIRKKIPAHPLDADWLLDATC